MKLLNIKRTFSALSAVVLLAGCSQEITENICENINKELIVEAYSGSFVSSDLNSRAVTDGYNTSFEENDEIGIFVLRGDEVVVNNLKLKKNGASWTIEEGAKLYYYNDAQYIAYSPYVSDLTVTSEQGIIDYFNNKVASSGQTSLEEYKNADLMTSIVNSSDIAEDNILEFNFSHKMSMIEIQVPKRIYTTNDNYTYSAPLGLQIISGETLLSLCPFGIVEGKGIYRCLVQSSTEPLSLSGEFMDGTKQVSFPTEGSVSVVPEQGRYKSINVNYSYGDYEKIRDLEPGDYYYSDGSIYPGDLDNPPTVGCVGIIFHTETSDTETANGWAHGYVVALKNTNGEVAQFSPWGTGKAAGNAIDTDNALNQFNGYTMSNTLSAVTAVQTAKEYSVEIPGNTSGWYLPSASELAIFMNNFGQMVNSSLTFGTANLAVYKDQNSWLTALPLIEDRFEKVGGYITNAEVTSDRWWTTTEVFASSITQAWALEIKSHNGQVALIKRDKAKNEGSVRPIFAF